MPVNAKIQGPGDAASLPERLLWQEGDLLTQQHFQEERRRLEMLLAYRLALLHPHGWGVRRLEFDAMALADGFLRIDQLEAVMPDGMVVMHPCLGRDLLEIDLNALTIDLRQQAACIHLTIAASLSRGGEGITRYRPAGSIAVADELTQEDPVELERLIPEIGLVATESPRRSPPARFVSLPVARVRYEGEAIILDRYVPPALLVEPATPLFEAASRLTSTIRQRAGEASQKLAALQSAESADAIGLDWPTIRAMVAPLPRLEALLASHAAHPFELFLGLCDLAGSLAGIGRQPLAAQLPAYDHRDPLAAYDRVLKIVDQTLGHARESFNLLRLERDGSGRFRLPADSLADKAEMLIGLRLARGQSASRLSDWFTECVIASSGSLPAVRQSRSMGAERRRIDGSEELWLTPPADVLLFAVRLDLRFVRLDEPLEILGPMSGADRAAAEIVIYQKPDGTRITTDPALDAMEPA